MSRANVIDLGYLVAAVLFIVGLKGLGRPRTAPRGNLMGATGMLIAVLVTLVDQSILSYQFLAIGLALGIAIGALLALRVQMTSMPELVALFNGFGGGASVLVAASSFIEINELGNSTGMNGELNCNQIYITISNATIKNFKGTKNLYSSKIDAHTRSGNQTSYQSNSNPGYIFIQTTSLSKQIMVSSCTRLPCTDVKNQLVNLIMVE